MLKLILGAAGSGKSTLLLNEVLAHAEAHPRERHVLLVPEQFTLETQRRLLKAHPRHAMLNIEAVSFDHVARRVFRELGEDDKAILEDTAAQMLLTLAMQRCETELTVYRRQLQRASFGTRLSSLFAEWEMNGLGEEQLRPLCEEDRLSPLLREKLRELLRLYDEFHAVIGQSRMTAEEVLPKLARLLPESGIYSGAYLYLDGFTGFTAVQYRILTQLMRRCPETTAAVTLPEEEFHGPAAGTGAPREESQAPAGADYGLFAMSRETVRRLEACAQEAGQTTTYTFARGGARKAPDRSFLEERVLRFGPEAAYEGPVRTVRLTACRTPAEEAQYAAATVLHLMREGLRCREIAVVLGDAEGYGPLVENAFEKAGIPYFTDRRLPLGAHPLVRLLDAAMDSVRRSFDRDSLLFYLKNPLGPLSEEETDSLENYLLAAGVRGGRRLREPFTKEVPDYVFSRENAEALRERACGKLFALGEAIRGKSVAEAAAAFEAFLDDAVPPEEADIFTPSCREVQTALHAFLDNMAGILGGCTLSLKSLQETLRAGLEALTLGRVPAGLDMVSVGDVERSRFGDVKALLFLGLNEGNVPKATGTGGLLTDRERHVLEGFVPELGYTDERAAREERFYLYSLLAKPTGALYLSCAAASGSGVPLLPSTLVEEIRKLLPGLETRRFRAEVLTRQLTGADSLAELAAIRLGGQESEESWGPLLEVLAGDPACGPQLEKIERGALERFRQRTLPPELAERLYGANLSGSVSRFERFTSCPYQHFLQYALDLRERELFSWDPRSHGTFFHAVMQAMLGRLAEEGRGAADLAEEELEPFVREAMRRGLEAAGETLGENIAGDYLLGRWERLFLEQLSLRRQFESTEGYVPDAFELKFGSWNVPENVLALSGGHTLDFRGVIDRVDIHRKGDRTYLRVVDYKTSGHTFDNAALWYGQSLQLPIYLDAAVRLYQRRHPEEEIRPAGLYYALLSDIWTKEGDDRGKELRKKLYLSGITLEEEQDCSPDTNAKAVSETFLEAVRGYAREKVRAIGEEILGGEIAIRPTRSVVGGRLPCDMCPYRAVCRFDTKVPGTQYRTLPRLDSRDAAQLILDNTAPGEEEPR